MKLKSRCLFFGLHAEIDSRRDLNLFKTSVMKLPMPYTSLDVVGFSISNPFRLIVRPMRNIGYILALTTLLLPGIFLDISPRIFLILGLQTAALLLNVLTLAISMVSLATRLICSIAVPCLPNYIRENIMKDDYSLNRIIRGHDTKKFEETVPPYLNDFATFNAHVETEDFLQTQGGSRLV